MLTSDRMAAVEANAVALGVSRARLVEASASAVASEVRACAAGDAASAVDAASPGNAESDERSGDGGAEDEGDEANPGDAEREPDAEGIAVAVVAGSGANGAVALAAARHLDEFDVSVSLLGRPESIATRTGREDWEALAAAEIDARPVTYPRALDLGDADAVVDGILGPGHAGEPGEPERTAIEAVDACDATTVAVDVPSGLDGNAGETSGVAVDADRVVTFHAAKPGLDSSQNVTVADVGVPAAAERFAGPGDVRRLRGRLRENRGEDDSGRIFVVGGGPYTGAPALSAQAALRGGADLAFVAVPDAVADPIRGYAEDLIVQPYPGDRLTPDRTDDLVETAASHDDVVVLGPGLGDADETREAVEAFLSAYDGRAVVDADAIPAVPEVETDATLVLTPNTAELAEIGGPSVDDLRDDLPEIESFAADLGHALAVKSAETVVTDGDETRIVRTGTPGMTVGGTGDIFAGLTAAFLGVAPPIEAAGAAGYVKGRAGERLAAAYGDSFVASDLLGAIPPVIWEPDGEPASRR